MNVPFHSSSFTRSDPGLYAAGAVRFRELLRALAEEIDNHAGPQRRDALLRDVGKRMARLLPLPEVATIDALSLEMNDALAAIGWGQVHLALQETESSLLITHAELPRIGSLGEPAGCWLAAVLEGLYETWLSAQPGSDPALTVRREPSISVDTVILRYAHR
jgi:Cellulose synthase subunit D